MRKCLITLVLLTVTICPGYAQNLVKHFQATASDIRFEAAINQYVFFGAVAPPVLSGMDNTGPLGPLRRINLQLLDDQLNTLWVKTYATQTEVNRAIALQGPCRKLTNSFHVSSAHRTIDGGYIICGYSEQNTELIDCPGLPLFKQPFLLKTNSSGGVVWYKRYDVYGSFSDVVEDRTTGRLIACGAYGGPDWSGLIAGTDAAGNLLWTKGAKSPTPYPGGTLSTTYIQIIPFTTKSGQFCYALAGNADQNGMGVDGGILISLIDINGSFLRDAVFHQDAFYMFPICDGIADAGNGKLVLTGASIDASGGYPCGSDNGSMILLKIDPMSFAVDFFKVYNKIAGAYSYGRDIGVWHDGADTRYSVIGRFSGFDGAVYLETDDNGNVLRYTPHDPVNAGQAGKMTINTLAGYPVYSGGCPGGSFVIRNNYGVDCAPDISVGVENLPYGMFVSDHYTMPLTAIAETMLDYSLPFSETIACGVLRPAPTGIAEQGKSAVFSIAPNPVSDRLDIKVADDNMTAVSVFDLSGRKVLQQAVSGTRFSLNVSRLVPGMYLLRLQNKAGSVEHTSFVKE